MHIQHYGGGLTHSSYAILSRGKIALVDSGCNPQPYQEFAESLFVQVVVVI